MQVFGLLVLDLVDRSVLIGSPIVAALGLAVMHYQGTAPLSVRTRGFDIHYDVENGDGVRI
jgi:NO-binding membrane sensor protein with MHYT domain